MDLIKNGKEGKKMIEILPNNCTNGFYIDPNSNYSPEYYNSVFTSFFDVFPYTTYSLRDKNGNKHFSFEDNTTFNSIEEQTLLLDAEQKENDFENYFTKLYKEGKSILEFKTSGQIISFLTGINPPPEDPFYIKMVLQRALELSMIFIIRDKTYNPLTASIVNPSNFSDESRLFKEENLTNAITNVIIEFFGETCLWNDAQLPTTYSSFDLLIGMLLDMVQSSKNNLRYIRDGLKPFCPSQFAELFVINFTNAALLRMNEYDAFSLESKIFTDSWLIKAFRTVEDLSKFIFSKNIACVFPYVAIYCLVYKWCYADEEKQTKKSAQILAASITQIGAETLFFSTRVTKAVIYPILSSFYDRYLMSDKPYLEMVDAQKEKIMEKLTLLLPAIRTSLTKNAIVEFETLNCIAKFLTKMKFEPKGMALILISFLNKHEIVSPVVFNTWVDDFRDSKGKLSAMLEIIPFINSISQGLPQKEI